MTNFIIFTTQRSGSTVLTRTLDGHPEIFCAGELFHESTDIYHPEWHFPVWALSQKSKMLRKFDKILNYPNLRFRAIPHIKKFFNSPGSNEKARGFKLMISHMRSMPNMWDYLKKDNAKVIVLIRKNVFNTGLSRLRKDETRVPHAAGTVTVTEKFRVAPNKLLKHMQYLEKVNQELLDYTRDMPRIVLYYEDFGNWDAMMNQVFSFLEVGPQTLPPVLKKIGGTSWRDDVTNYEEIEKLLKENNYNQYL
jgi:Sulfotransferase family